jgi:hypothetical protein
MAAALWRLASGKHFHFIVVANASELCVHCVKSEVNRQYGGRIGNCCWGNAAMSKWVSLFALACAATPAAAEPRIDIHGLVEGPQAARFVKGVPTIDLPLQKGAVQVRPLGFDHNDTVFAVAVFNAGAEPANIALEDMHAIANGNPIRIWTGQDLARQAKNRAIWAELGIAFLSATGSALAATQRNTYHGSFVTPNGMYSYSSSYPSVAGQLQANAIMANSVMAMATIQQRLDFALANIDENVIQRTTVDPGMSYGAIVVVNKVDYRRAPFELQLTVDWNGERYPFAFLLTKTGQAAPQEYLGRLAENNKPRAINRSWAPKLAASTGGAPPPPQGAIFLASGAVKIPAKTGSGYCLQTPDGYVGTGDLNYPAINGALPRCNDIKKPNENGWYPTKR